MIYTCKYISPLGGISMASDGASLTGLWLDGQKYFSQTLPQNYETYEQKDLLIFADTKRWLDIYFAGKKPDFTPALHLEGSPFRMAVWEILLQIPYGQTITYGEIAKKIAQKRGLPSMSAQAVGGAVGHNPISIIVPCHRVVGTGGSLTGYAGGVDKKIKLLKLEGVSMEAFFVP